MAVHERVHIMEGIYICVADVSADQRQPVIGSGQDNNRKMVVAETRTEIDTGTAILLREQPAARRRLPSARTHPRNIDFEFDGGDASSVAP